VRRRKVSQRAYFIRISGNASEKVPFLLASNRARVKRWRSRHLLSAVKRFGNVEYVDAVPEDREASLLRMRKKMLSRDDLSEAVFIGGMEGILEEYTLFTELHPKAKILAVPAPGGAARQLAERLGVKGETDLQNVDFAKLFHVELNVAPNESRSSLT
jgi:SLOG cluster3 family